MHNNIPRSVELTRLEEPPARYTGYKCRYCGDCIAEGEEIVEIQNEIYHYGCLDIGMLLKILDISVKEASTWD